MSRTHSKLSQEIIQFLAQNGPVTEQDLFSGFAVEHERKVVYDTLFRLRTQGLIDDITGKLKLSNQADSLMARLKPTRDGLWKIVIFDIPEKKRYVRNHLRNKLKALGFKKWQESTWITPYIIPTDIEAELVLLGEKFFVRLIKTSSISKTEDLEKLFPPI